MLMSSFLSGFQGASEGFCSWNSRQMYGVHLLKMLSVICEPSAREARGARSQ